MHEHSQSLLLIGSQACCKRRPLVLRPYRPPLAQMAALGMRIHQGCTSGTVKSRRMLQLCKAPPPPSTSRRGLQSFVRSSHRVRYSKGCSPSVPIGWLRVSVVLWPLAVQHREAQPLQPTPPQLLRGSPVQRHLQMEMELPVTSSCSVSSTLVLVQAMHHERVQAMQHGSLHQASTQPSRPL
jgi:hypothetical protein